MCEFNCVNSNVALVFFRGNRVMVSMCKLKCCCVNSNVFLRELDNDDDDDNDVNL